MVEADVHVVDRGHIRTDANRIVEGHTRATAAEPDPELSIGEGPVYNLLIDHPEGVLLWDTGSHPEAGKGHWPAEQYEAFEHYNAEEYPLDESLEGVGYGIKDVDFVLQTHLHLDHAGGLEHFAGTGVPVFVHESELKHAYYSATRPGGSDAYILEDFDHDLNWQVLHRERERHLTDIEFLHLPGHTPGVVGTLLRLDERTLLLTSDEAYVRANYEYELPLGGELLWSKPHWRRSLRWLKDVERRHDALVVAGHDAEDVERLRAELG
ncbi:MBL fold metallo-hydrolase [Halobacteriales archaeon QS_3_64_16]|nr:MAG: MBL fold metallo-hydrolase [Halobacteriales archaeon QS_3_64_16]